MQKLRLWWKGSQRRRDDFATRNIGWSSGGQAPPPVHAGTGQARAPALHRIDRDGLLSAYLDQSGQILYYFDPSTGEVIESREPLSNYARVPTQDDAADRDAFIKAHNLNVGASFREAIARDRTLERAWYNFKTQRANEAIDAWLAKGSG